MSQNNLIRNSLACRVKDFFLAVIFCTHWLRSQYPVLGASTVSCEFPWAWLDSGDNVEVRRFWPHRNDSLCLGAAGNERRGKQRSLCVVWYRWCNSSSSLIFLGWRCPATNLPGFGSNKFSLWKPLKNSFFLNPLVLVYPQISFFLPSTPLVLFCTPHPHTLMYSRSYHPYTLVPITPPPPHPTSLLCSCFPLLLSCSCAYHPSTLELIACGTAAVTSKPSPRASGLWCTLSWYRAIETIWSVAVCFKGFLKAFMWE